MNESRPQMPTSPVIQTPAPSTPSRLAWHFIESPTATRNWLLLLMSLIVGWAFLMAFAFSLSV